MKKNMFWVSFWGNSRKLLLTMKLCLLFLLISSATLMGSNVYSQSTMLSLHLKNATLKELIEAIEDQSDFIFVYYDGVMNFDKQINISVSNKTIEQILDLVFESTDQTYHIDERQISIGKKDPITNEFVFPHSDKADTEQNKNISGTVTGENGEPIPGATIIVKGTTVGTISAADGTFNLVVPENAEILSVSFVGYITQEISLSGTNVFNVVLKESIEGLEEVVVVGYGVQKKVTVTGAVSSIETEDIVRGSSASLANTLAGRISGLTSIQAGGGQPGRDDATMYLRGAATTNGKNPLILIDGVPRDNIRTIDPNEVASISILKDASATALFGVRGANGVILITTRRGTEGKMQLSINAEQSYSSFTREPERLHSWEYMNLRNEASQNDGISPLPYDETTISRYINPLEGLDPNAEDYAEQKRIREYMYPDHDYYREYISRYSPQTRLNMNASGGSQKIGFFVNAGYLHQGGNLKTEPKSVLGYDPSSKMDRYNFRANIDYNITQSLKSFLNIGSYIEQVNMPAAWLYENDTNWMMRDLIYQAQTILPITPGPTTIDGFGVEPGQIVDPGYMDRSAFEIMNRMGYRNEVRSNLNTSIGLEWDLSNSVTKGLSIKGLFSYDSKATTAMQGEKRERLYLAEVNSENNTMSYAVKRSDESLLSIVKGADSRYNVNMQGIINYNRTFGEKHDVTGMVLAQRDYWESTKGEIPYNVVGFSGRFTYAYDSRYLAEVDMGYNGSEQFAPDNRFGFFPAVSLGWIVSNEKFMDNQEFLTNLKLRASYGLVGNDQIGEARFLYQDNISMGSGTLGSLGLGKDISQGLLGNTSLSWELAKKQNYGVDFQLLDNLNVTLDYFIEKRSKILISRGMVPELQGVPLGNVPKVNMGKVDNSGFELEVTYNKTIGKDLHLMVRGNYNYNHNEVKFLDEPMRDDTYAYQYRSTGYPLSSVWGYKIDYSNGNGYFNSQEELNQYLQKTLYSFGTPRVGDFKYIDLNNDGVVDDKDQAPIGYSGIPGITYGLTLNLSYKSFDFMVFLQGVGRYGKNYSSQGVYEYTIRGTYFDYHKHAWTEERYLNGEEITYPALSTHSNTNHVANDFFIMDRSFTRLKNIEIGYTLSQRRFLNVLGISSLRVYASAQNLFTWDHLEMGHLDPENDDALGYPVTTMKNFGLDITF